jgi:hypothetical protein
MGAKRRIPKVLSFVRVTIGELQTLRYFFWTMDTELDRVIESEDMVTTIESGYNPEAKQDLEVRSMNKLYEDDYWEKLREKFHNRFYAAMVLLTVSVLEAGLARLARHLVATQRVSTSVARTHGSTLDQFHALAQQNGWPLPPTESWQRVKHLYRVRNTLIHEGGRPLNLSEEGYRAMADRLQQLAKENPSLRVIDEIEPISLTDILKEGRKGTPRRRETPATGLTLVVQRDFCIDALDAVSIVLNRLFEPFSGAQEL